MRSVSDPPTPRQMWLAERRDEAAARFAARIPALYTQQIDLPAFATAWATTGHDTPGSLFLTGSIGVGKTHTAWQTARTWLESCFTGAYRGNPVIATYRSTALFDALRPDALPGDGRDLIPALQTADLLFIDDLAAARPSAWTQERLFEIFDERYINARPVLITCDVLPNALGDVVGPRVASRLAEMCRDGVHLMQGDDRRKGGAR